MPGKFLVTYFDEKTWHSWGLTWTCSVFCQDLACKIVIFDYGIPDTKFLQKIGIEVIKTNKKFLDALCYFCTINPGQYVFWDYSHYLQGSPEVFFSEDFLVSVACDITKKFGNVVLPGFFAGSSDQILLLRDFNKFYGFTDCLNLFALSFDFVKVTPFCTSIGYHSGSVLVRVPKELHFSAESSFYHFRNLFPRLYEQWRSFSLGNPILKLKLLK